MADDRNLLATSRLAAICCLRVAERRARRDCHLVSDFLRAYGIPGHEDTLALRVVTRKKASELRGHCPAVGSTVHPDRDLVHEIAIGEGGPPPASGCQCTSSAPALRAGVPCHACAPVFPRLVLGPGSRGSLRRIRSAHDNQARWCGTPSAVRHPYSRAARARLRHFRPPGRSHHSYPRWRSGEIVTVYLQTPDS